MYSGLIAIHNYGNKPGNIMLLSIIGCHLSELMLLSKSPNNCCDVDYIIVRENNIDKIVDDRRQALLNLYNEFFDEVKEDVILVYDNNYIMIL